MNLIIDAEKEFLLNSIIETEGWHICPKEDYFYEKLENIKNNSAEEFKYIIDELVGKLKKYEFTDVKDYINWLIECLNDPELQDSELV